MRTVRAEGEQKEGISLYPGHQSQKAVTVVMGILTVSPYGVLSDSPKNSMPSVTVLAIDIFHNVDRREPVAQEGTERKGHPFANSCILRNSGVPRGGPGGDNCLYI